MLIETALNAAVAVQPVDEMVWDGRASADADRWPWPAARRALPTLRQRPPGNALLICRPALQCGRLLVCKHAIELRPDDPALRDISRRTLEGVSGNMVEARRDAPRPTATKLLSRRTACDIVNLSSFGCALGIMHFRFQPLEVGTKVFLFQNNHLTGYGSNLSRFQPKKTLPL
jgi:hypothetical protein